MKKRLLCIILAAVFAWSLALTAAAAGPAPGDGPTEAEASAPAPDTTGEPADVPGDGPVDELPDGPGDGASDDTSDDPSEGSADEPTDDPANDPLDGAAEEPADGTVDGPDPAAPANIAADEPMPIAAQESNVSYVDANGGALTCPSATVVEEEAVEWAEGWYVAKGTVTVPERVAVTGGVDLILADGCSLTVNGGIQVFAGNSLTIWGQAGGTGELNADGSAFDGVADRDSAGWYAGIGGDSTSNGVGTITINGGDITATGGGQNAGIGSANRFEKIIINGGKVTASGRVGIGARGEGSNGGAIEINGGTVTASSFWPDDISVGIGGHLDSVTITGGTVTATGGDGYDISGSGGAGISSTGSGDITITGGTVTAAGGDGFAYNVGGAGIDSSGSGQITVSGGTVKAAGGNNGSSDYTSAGIEGGFSTGENGNAMVYSSGIGDQSGKGSWSGVIFEENENEGQVYGSPTVTESFTLHDGQTLTVPEGSALTVGEGVTLTNDGAIQNRGNIKRAGSGTITGSGRIYGDPVDGYGLEIAAPTFDEVKYGYAQPAAQVIAIKNTGSDTAHISKVELTGNTEAFALTGPLAGELPPGGSDTSWTIRPQTGLEADSGPKSYEAVVSVTYDFGCTVTAGVSFTVDQAMGAGTVAMGDYTCGDSSVEPEIHSTTNTAGTEGDDYIFYKARGADDDTYSTDKPTASGEYTVKVVFEDGKNYRGPTVTADFRVTHKFNTDWERREDGSHRACGGCGTELLLTTEALTAVPAGLADKYDSVQALTQALAGLTGTGENYAVWDVVLKAREDGSKDWHEAAPADFPDEGVPVTLPYPEGTDRGYTFTAVHMFAAGEMAGRTEKPAVKNDADGVTFTVTGLSPVCIGWRAPAAAPGATASPAAAAPYTGDGSPLLFWTAALCLAGAALGALLLRRRRG